MEKYWVLNQRGGKYLEGFFLLLLQVRRPPPEAPEEDFWPRPHIERPGNEGTRGRNDSRQRAGLPGSLPTPPSRDTVHGPGTQAGVERAAFPMSLCNGLWSGLKKSTYR